MIESLRAEFLTEFIRSGRERLSSLQTQLDTQTALERELIARTAHQLAGEAELLELQQAALVLHELEDAARISEDAQVRSRCREILGTIEQEMQALATEGGR